MDGLCGAPYNPDPDIFFLGEFVEDIEADLNTLCCHYGPDELEVCEKCLDIVIAIWNYE